MRYKTTHRRALAIKTRAFVNVLVMNGSRIELRQWRLRVLDTSRELEARHADSVIESVESARIVSSLSSLMRRECARNVAVPVAKVQLRKGSPPKARDSPISNTMM